MLKKILLIVFSMFFIVGKANADIHGTHSLSPGSGSYFCPPGANLSFSGIPGGTVQVVPNSCTLSSSAYVPVSGYYSVETVAYINQDGVPSQQYFETSSAYLDASKSIAQQEVTVSGWGGGDDIFSAERIYTFMCISC